MKENREKSLPFVSREAFFQFFKPVVGDDDYADLHLFPPHSLQDEIAISYILSDYFTRSICPGVEENGGKNKCAIARRENYDIMTLSDRRVRKG
jgi:hypothetical protein